jgi:hypothetical protein
MAYQAGELHFDWKTPFLKYVIERKIATIQDIDWSDFFSKFPTQTRKSMDSYLTNVLRKNVSDQPFYKRLIDLWPTLRNDTERPFVAKHREDIVFLYDKVRGIS